MRYFFSTLCLCLCFGFCAVQAQPIITLKPGQTDSARWELTKVLPDGTTQIYYEPYDTLPNVIEFGRVLYTSGGFIGGGRIGPNEDFYDEEVLQFMKTRGIPMNEDRQILDGVIKAFGSAADSPMEYDTMTNHDLVGSWVASNRTCGMTTDTITVAVEFVSGNAAHRLSLYDANDNYVSEILTLGDGVISFSSLLPVPLQEYRGLGEQLTVARTSPVLWQGPFGCEWKRVEQ